MREKKRYKDAYESVYNVLVLSKVKEAENYLAIYNCIGSKERRETKSLLKKYMFDLLCKLESNYLETPEFTLDRRCAKRKDKVIKEISDILA